MEAPQPQEAHVEADRGVLHRRIEDIHAQQRTYVENYSPIIADITANSGRGALYCLRHSLLGMYVVDGQRRQCICMAAASGLQWSIRPVQVGNTRPRCFCCGRAGCRVFRTPSPLNSVRAWSTWLLNDKGGSSWQWCCGTAHVVEDCFSLQRAA